MIELNLLKSVPAAWHAKFSVQCATRLGNHVLNMCSGSGRFWINASQYFDGVPLETWRFKTGGYQVCEKWLKDRKGRQLDFADIQHYGAVVGALIRTRALTQEIDAIASGTLWLAAAMTALVIEPYNDAALHSEPADAV